MKNFGVTSSSRHDGSHPHAGAHADTHVGLYTTHGYAWGFKIGGVMGPKSSTDEGRT